MNHIPFTYCTLASILLAVPAAAELPEAPQASLTHHMLLHEQLATHFTQQYGVNHPFCGMLDYYEFLIATVARGQRDWELRAHTDQLPATHEAWALLTRISRAAQRVIANEVTTRSYDDETHETKAVAHLIRAMEETPSPALMRNAERREILKEQVGLMIGGLCFIGAATLLIRHMITKNIRGIPGEIGAFPLNGISNLDKELDTYSSLDTAAKKKIIDPGNKLVEGQDL
jgi:hypothetical protein